MQYKLQFIDIAAGAGNLTEFFALVLGGKGIAIEQHPNLRGVLSQRVSRAGSRVSITVLDSTLSLVDDAEALCSAFLVRIAPRGVDIALPVVKSCIASKAYPAILLPAVTDSSANQLAVLLMASKYSLVSEDTPVPGYNLYLPDDLQLGRDLLAQLCLAEGQQIKIAAAVASDMVREARVPVSGPGDAVSQGETAHRPAAPPRELRATAFSTPGGVMVYRDVPAGQLSSWERSAGEAKPAQDTVFVQGDPIEVEPDCFYRLHLTGTTASAFEVLYIVVRDVDTAIDISCRQVVLRGRPAFRETFEFRTLHRTGRVALEIRARTRSADAMVRVSRCVLGYLGTTKSLDASSLRYDALASRHQPLASAGRRSVISMATVAGREVMLLDAVSSLYRQASKIRVFLNQHTDVPSYLDDAKIELAWSRDYGDLGDAGKFFWVEQNDGAPLIVVDDDFLYPIDFCQRMHRTLDLYSRRAVVGTHGILLRQPTAGYYDRRSRYVSRGVIAQGDDLLCHALGTGAICYDPSVLPLKRRDFGFPNMADIWLMERCQNARIPMISIARPHSWLIDNKMEQPTKSIYSESSTASLSSFNTSEMQTHVTRLGWPVLTQPRTRRGQTIGRMLSILEVAAGTEEVDARLKAWLTQRPNAYDCSLVILADEEAAEAAVWSYLERNSYPCEVHVIGPGVSAAITWDDRLREILRRSVYDVGLYVSTAVDLQAVSLRALVDEAIKSKSEVTSVVGDAGDAKPLVLTWRCQPGLIPDESATLALGFVGDSLLTAAKVKGCSVSSSSQIGWAVKAKPQVERSEPKGAKAAADYAERAGQRSQGAATRKAHKAAASPEINNVFERVFVLNLDRRPDRLEQFDRQAKLVGMNYERFSAVDGSKDPDFSEWTAYCATPLVPFPAGCGPFRWEYDFYNKYTSDVHRIAHLEAKFGRKVMSKGGWGYQKSIISILQRAIREGWRSVLIFDDDCLFHKNTRQLFAEAYQKMREDWMLLSLGALQYDWTDKSITWAGDSLYHCRGSSVASHAVGIRDTAYAPLLKTALRMDLPFDVGAQHTVKREFAERCFVSYPNLFIQDTTETDIGDSSVQLAEGRKEKNKYRWVLSDYGEAAFRRSLNQDSAIATLAAV
jgi:hypothetical protein